MNITSKYNYILKKISNCLRDKIFTAYPKDYTHDLCYDTFAVFWYQLFVSKSFRITSLALGQSYDCSSASEVTLKNMCQYISDESNMIQ